MACNMVFGGANAHVSSGGPLNPLAISEKLSDPRAFCVKWKLMNGGIWQCWPNCCVCNGIKMVGSVVAKNLMLANPVVGPLVLCVIDK
jgi:hypothetical protein